MKNPIKYISADRAYIDPSDSVIVVDCSVTACAVYFSHPAANYKGTYTVKKSDTGSNAVTIYPFSGEDIDGASSVTLTYQGDYKTLAPVGDGFSVISPAALLATFATPVTPVAATGALTFTGVVADGETVTIGSDVYEFDTDEEVGAGHILVDVSGGATASAAVTALVAAITASDTQGVGAADGTGDVVNLTADVKGAAANSIATTTDCTNATFAAAKLGNGVDGTVGLKGQIMVDASYIYVSTAVSTVAESHWEKVAIS